MDGLLKAEWSCTAKAIFSFNLEKLQEGLWRSLFFHSCLLTHLHLWPENINTNLYTTTPVHPGIHHYCIATRTHHTHTPAHPVSLPHSKTYHWVFAERLRFPFEQRWSPAVTPARHRPRILATACRSEGGLPAPHGAAPFDPVCRGHSPTNQTQTS